MNPLTKQDILPYDEYERQRQTFRQRIIEFKKKRRISVGDHVTLIFENRQTVLFQVQEMIRTERIFEPAKIQEELDVYNVLLPRPSALSATLFIEITAQDRMVELLNSFQGIDHPGTVAIRSGLDAVYGEFETGHSKEDKISAVHFVRFQVPPHMQAHMMQRTHPTSLAIHHFHYQAEVTVPDDLLTEWAADLASHNASP